MQQSIIGDVYFTYKLTLKQIILSGRQMVVIKLNNSRINGTQILSVKGVAVDDGI